MILQKLTHSFEKVKTERVKWYPVVVKLELQRSLKKVSLE